MGLQYLSRQATGEPFLLFNVGIYCYELPFENFFFDIQSDIYRESTLLKSQNISALHLCYTWAYGTLQICTTRQDGRVSFFSGQGLSDSGLSVIFLLVPSDLCH